MLLFRHDCSPTRAQPGQPGVAKPRVRRSREAHADGLAAEESVTFRGNLLQGMYPWTPVFGEEMGFFVQGACDGANLLVGGCGIDRLAIPLLFFLGGVRVGLWICMCRFDSHLLFEKPPTGP